MPGRPPWSQPGTQGGGQTVAVNNRPEIIGKHYEQSANLAPGAAEETAIFAPSNSVWKFRSAYIFVPAPESATTGSHQYEVRTTQGIMPLKGTSTYDTACVFHGLTWTAANSSKKPTTESAQEGAVRSLMATENQPVKVKYVNETDVTQSKKRKQNIAVEEVTY